MKRIVKYVYIILSLFFLIYLAYPLSNFPTPLDDSLRSQEPADTETELRRAYFTNYDRDYVMSYYTDQLSGGDSWYSLFPTYRLNYPPEESQSLIRDQTRSTFLEEIVHPMRESVYVNGFKPENEKDTIIIENKVWLQKIIVRHVPSNLYMRLIVGLGVVVLVPIIIGDFGRNIRRLVIGK